MKYFFLLTLGLFIFSAHAETFPAKLTCNTGEQITLTVTGAEQRMTYVSSRYGTFHGYLDIYKGVSPEQQFEALADIHGMGRYKDNPLSFSLQMKRINGEIDNGAIIYRYTYMKEQQMINEEGNCIPMKDGGFIEGSKHY
ncbi:hypothetical protein ACNY92_005112 [Citrobacter freundii]|uniref:Uncharacterized protein n=1 Tax=Citrobacter freundii TaxID=546 RepID=A0A9P3Z3A4_CITFR|nr:hypothetical protein [Citrobacter freundii]HAT3737811.1 hypothetical protein [Citrobacter freundii]HBH7040695.1 hypothetical protein [Citrobacter freundii]HED2385676.1 hypothetical protein [Citrobacter freundii]HED3665745.1 hypothetical protein [Citrobacter freundii]